MADGVMTARAHDSLGVAVCTVAVDGCRNAFMAMPAGAFHDLVIELRDLDVVWIVAACEIEGMPEAVVRFDRVFSNDVVWCVAVVAGRGAVVARLDPSVVLLTHDVAVYARLRIVGEVGVPLRVDERVPANAI